MRWWTDGKSNLTPSFSVQGASARPGHRPAAIAMAAGSLCCAFLLLALAVPRLAASWKRLPGNAAVELFEAGALPIASGMTRAIVAQTDSLAIMPEPGPHLTIAYMSTALTEGVGLAETQRDDLLDVARYHLERAIAMAPVQARGWFMLAGLRYNDGGDLDAAAQALTLSFASDPHSPLLAPFRWPMVFALGSQGRCQVGGRRTSLVPTLHPHRSIRQHGRRRRHRAKSERHDHGRLDGRERSGGGGGAGRGCGSGRGWRGTAGRAAPT